MAAMKVTTLNGVKILIDASLPETSQDFRSPLTAYSQRSPRERARPTSHARRLPRFSQRHKPGTGEATTAVPQATPAHVAETWETAGADGVSRGLASSLT